MATDSVSGPITFAYSDTGCGSGCSGVANKVASMTTALGTINYTYDYIGRRTSMSVTGQPTVNYSYDADNRLTTISTLISGAVATFNIGYDDMGRRTFVARPNGVTTDYTFDNANRLLSLQHIDSSSNALESLVYTYDANDNRTTVNRPSVNLPLPNSASNISYNEVDEMLAFNDKTISYDANGNMTSVSNTCGMTTYMWDARNRLTRINGFAPDCTSLTASFKYDGLGRRIEKTINGQTVQYLYDGYNIIQEIKNGASSAHYIMTDRIDEPLARIQADGIVNYFQSDALGSIIALTDSNGRVQTTYSYDPFGNVAITGAVSDNPFQYTGRESDGTGLYYYRARYYSPELQRFISRDPIGLKGGINFYAYVDSVGKPTINTNLYSYTENNPINRIDPLGLWSISIDAYEGLGGGIVFGKNPDGGSFITFRVGYGIGGGISYNPKGTSPGANECGNHRGLGVGIGGFGSANIGLGPGYIGAVGNAGANTSYKQFNGYNGSGFEYGLDMGWHLRGGAAVGGELTFY